ncbi:MAG: DUF3667 domain-containing protein [Armatimonas sp.]
MRKRSEPHSLSPICLNCGAEVSTRFCGECGQENEPPTPTFSNIAKDLWDEFLAIDGKLLKTLWYLFARPGLLSTEYISGRRSSYISPFKLYFWTTALFVVFILRLNIIDAEQLQYAADKVKMEAIATPQPGAKATPEPKKSAQTEFYVTLPNGKKRIRMNTGKASGKEAMAAGLRIGLPNITASAMRVLGEHIDPDTLPDSVVTYRTNQSKLPGEKRDSLKRQFLSERLIRLKNNPWDGLKSIVATGIPNVLIFCVPLWALIIKLFFPSRLYIEHLIFALHTHVFGVICFALSIALWTAAPNAEWLFDGVLIAIPIYNFFAARRFYPEHPAWLLLKGTGLSCAYGCILVFAALFGLIFTLIWTLVSA